MALEPFGLKISNDGTLHFQDNHIIFCISREPVSPITSFYPSNLGGSLVKWIGGADLRVRKTSIQVLCLIHANNNWRGGKAFQAWGTATENVWSGEKKMFVEQQGKKKAAIYTHAMCRQDGVREGELVWESESLNLAPALLPTSCVTLGK